MVKKRLVLSRRKKLETEDSEIIESSVTEPVFTVINTDINNVVEDLVKTLPEISESPLLEVVPVPVLDIEIQNGILNNPDSENIDDTTATLCKFDKIVSEPLDISLNCVEVLADPVDHFNNSIRQLMLERNDIYKPYIEETVSEPEPLPESFISINEILQDRNDNVKNSSRTTAPKTRRMSMMVSRNRSL